jgi:hypothetical protein
MRSETLMRRRQLKNGDHNNESALANVPMPAVAGDIPFAQRLTARSPKLARSQAWDGRRFTS